MLHRYEPALLLAWSMLTGALAFGGIEHPIRAAVVLIFLAAVPGLALSRMLNLTDPVLRALLAVPVSLALAAVVSAALVYGGVPSWDLGLTALISITVGAVAVDLARSPVVARARRRAPATKLDDPERQARLIEALMDGSSMPDAARAAGVSLITLRRALVRSEDLRRAVTVASLGAVIPEDEAARPRRGQEAPAAASIHGVEESPTSGL